MPRNTLYFVLLLASLSCGLPAIAAGTFTATTAISPEPLETFTPIFTTTPTYVHLVYLLAGTWKGVYENVNGERLDVVLEVFEDRFAGTNQFPGTILFYREGGEGKAWFAVYPTLEKNTIYFEIEAYLPMWNDGLPLESDGAYYYFTHNGGDTITGNAAVQCYQCSPYATIRLTRIGSERGLIEQIVSTPTP